MTEKEIQERMRTGRTFIRTGYQKNDPNYQTDQQLKKP